jgi:foldase protein PrsA
MSPVMRRFLLPTLAVGLGLLGGAAVVGCGSEEGLPDDAVAKVGDTVITRADFERALGFAVGRGGDPRDFDACAQDKQRESGATEILTAQLVAQCKDEYERLEAAVMEYLVKSEWTRQEAEERDVRLSDSEVEQAVATAREGGLLDAKALSQAGVTERQLIARLRQSRLQSKVTDLLTAPARDISTQDIADYYRRHKAELVVPDRRDLRIVITRSRARAAAARAALDAGRSWRRVAAEFSLHLSRTQGGRVDDAERGSERKGGLGEAIFGAKRGVLTGPVTDGENWAVFVVERIEPSYMPTIEQARDGIEKTLASAREQRALDAYTAEYRGQTTCSPDFEIPACGDQP